MLSLGPDGLRLEPSEADRRLSRLAELWAEYDALTKRDWQTDRVVALRAQIRSLLGV